MNLVDARDMNGVRLALEGLRENDAPVVIANGSLLAPADWIAFLADACGFRIDRRHVSIQSRISEADWWAVSYDPARAQTYAHSKTRQPLHTDNAWFADGADLNFFVMQRQAASGGEQTLYRVDRLIDDLASDAPALLADLMSVPVTIRKADSGEKNLTTVLVDGARPEVHWNYYRTEKATKEVAAMCDAFFNYLEKREATSSVERLASKTGMCFAFNDAHLLHGRTAFEAEHVGDRVLLQSMWWFR